MIEAGRRKAVLLLHESGMSKREIAERLNISRDSVKRILKDRSEPIPQARSDRKKLNEERVRELFVKCSGYVQRVHEKLSDEGVEVGYSTLSRFIRSLGLANGEEDQRCYRVPDSPGAEMQHDTSPYRIKIGGKLTPVTGSLLYFRYCKQRYLKFYRSFCRFHMKCFFYESVTHFKYVAGICVIDNTNLAVLHGTGKDAVFVPEMIALGKACGFEWLAHEKGHSDRKAGEERSFWTVETNFFPGREFASMEDLNEQALRWSSETMANRPQTKARIVPNLAFETEKPYLRPLPPFVPEPYLEHERGTDQYGYAAFDANYYWVPGTGRAEVKLLEYRNRLQIWRNRQMLAEYALPPVGTKHQRFPDGKDAPPCLPRNRKTPTAPEEAAIKAVGEAAQAYLEWMAGIKDIHPQQRARLIREIHRLKSQMSPELFLQALARAKTYRITDPKVIERMACLMLRDSLYDAKWIDIGEEFASREIYHEGKLSAPADLSRYDSQEFLTPTENEDDDSED